MCDILSVFSGEVLVPYYAVGHVSEYLSYARDRKQKAALHKGGEEKKYYRYLYRYSRVQQSSTTPPSASTCTCTTTLYLYLYLVHYCTSNESLVVHVHLYRQKF